MPSPWPPAPCSDLHGVEEPSRYWALDFFSTAYNTYLLWSVLMLETFSVLDVPDRESVELLANLQRLPWAQRRLRNSGNVCEHTTESERGRGPEIQYSAWQCTPAQLIPLLRVHHKIVTLRRTWLRADSWSDHQEGDHARRNAKGVLNQRLKCRTVGYWNAKNRLVEAVRVRRDLKSMIMVTKLLI